MNPINSLVQGARNIGGLIQQAPGIIRNTVGVMQGNARTNALNQKKGIVQKAIPAVAQAVQPQQKAVPAFTGRMRAIKSMADSI